MKGRSARSGRQHKHESRAHRRMNAEILPRGQAEAEEIAIVDTVGFLAVSAKRRERERERERSASLHCLAPLLAHALTDISSASLTRPTPSQSRARYESSRSIFARVGLLSVRAEERWSDDRTTKPSQAIGVSGREGGRKWVSPSALSLSSPSPSLAPDLHTDKQQSNSTG